jgi:predicted CoA-substrate-specific enzyme activase
MKTYLGIDIGSLTIKFVLIDENANVLYWTYERTGGKPIEAIQKGLKKLKEWIENHNPKIEISGVGTTGSGRYLAGVIVGADLIKNEITAHAKGATYFVPDVRTVIDIGGQDSKIIILENGVAVDFAMNYLCVPPETKIITEDFIPKPISEIKVGEKVLTHLGRFKRVEEVFERDYKGEMIEISLSNLETLALTPEHPVLGLKREDIKCYYSYSRRNTPVCRQFNEKNCKKKCAKWKNFSWEPYFISAKELRKGDFVCTPLGLNYGGDDPPVIDYETVKLTISKFEKTPKIEIKDLPLNKDILRFLGYYLAEGNIAYNKARWDKKIKYPAYLQFVFNIKEKEYAKEIQEIIKKNFPSVKVKSMENPEHHSLILNVYNRPLAEFVLYLCGEKANKKRLAKELLALPPEFQKEIVKTFFRGDGQLRKRPKDSPSFVKKGNRYCASTTSEILASQFYWILLRNKIKASINKARKKTKGNKSVFFLEIYGEEINKFEDKKVVEVKSKKDRSFIFSNWLFEPIKKIKKFEYKGKLYNLKVEEDESYVANYIALHNCAAGTGSFLDAQAFRLGIPIEKFGELALKSKNPTTIASRCTVFCESDMIHKQQIGHKIEDIVAGLCQGLVRNYLANVAKGKKILPPILFVGGVSENVGMRCALEKALGQKIIVPKYNKVMGAFGVSLLVKENPPQKTKFRGFEISDMDIKCDSFICKGCPNQCEVIEAKMNGKIIARWGDRCGRWSNLKYD